MVGQTGPMGKKLVGAFLVVVVLVGAGVYWFVVRDDAPEELSLDSGSEGSTEAAGDAPDTFDGTWVVRTGGDTTAGFRIEEEFAGAISHTAVGRSPEVDGSLTLDGPEVTAADVIVDLTALEFTDDPPTGNVGNRAGAMEDDGLETAEFPEATFTLTEPVDLGGDPADGFTTTADAAGELTLHGVTAPVTVPLEARVEGDTIRVATVEPVPVALSDHDIEVRTPPFVASIADEGSFELLLVFEKA